MKKDTQFTLRIPAELKKELQNISAHEGRSMAQICEAFLRAGSEGYKKEGSKFLRRFLGRQKINLTDRPLVFLLSTATPVEGANQERNVRK